MKTPYVSISKALTIVLGFMVLGHALRAESLWPAERTRNLIANKVAAQRGDILTIVIGESTTVSNSLQTSTSKESSINNQVNQFLFSTAASGFGTHNEELPATDISGANEYQGGGTINNTTALTDRFSVMVADVLPNGNLVIEGARKLSYAGETQYVVLSGIVRYWDIQQDNTLDSNLIYNARIEYLSEGTLTNAQKKGWLEQLNEILNPF